MTVPGVFCNAVSKQFQRGEHHDSLRSLISSAFRRRRGDLSLGDRGFWAVRDVSFEVGPGQALGIIGANGAGKSTLLKLLTRVLQPTLGSISVRGRQGALIEIAAGFHPDLTGRENVGLQGAIMGMSQADIARKFDEIVEFAGVKDFIDTPVKRYSSGMNARLGFAIAAHLDPDVLIVDEVLSVGDFTFQAKAFGRIRELVKSGIPVVVVSHQLDRVAELCTDAILLDHGTVSKQGTPVECISAYLERGREGFASRGDTPSEVERLTVLSGEEINSGETLRLRVEGRINPGGVPEHVEPLVLVVTNSATGAVVSAISSSGSELVLHEGAFTVDVTMQMNVPRGIYTIQSGVYDRRHERTMGRGPALIMQVGEGIPFVGQVQLNGQMTVVSSTPPLVSA
jgi:ABC-type polysaccharide/polyol phosphate transport system ATPase subunit